MAEFFATLFTAGETVEAGAVIGTAETVATTASSAGEIAGAAYGTAAPAVTASEIIQGSAQAFGILSSLRSGQAQEAALKTQGRVEEVNAKASMVKAKTDENTARERLITTLAKNTAAAGASGVDLSSGSVVGAQEKAVTQANREMDLIRSGGELTSEQHLLQASILRQQAKSARLQGDAGAYFGLLDFAAKRSRVR
jgi:hypothetical protein